MITGSTTFTKSGDGILILSGTNTYTGATTISAGTLRVSGALDDTAITISSGATYDVDANDAVSSVTGAGAIDIASSVTLTIGADNSSTTLSGVISGDGNLIKVGSGTFTLSGANSYTGSTTVSEGVIRASHNTALGTVAGGTSVANGAALELSGSITIGSEALTLIGTGISNGGALRHVTGGNTYGGNITLSTSAVRINSDTGTFLISGTISNGSIGLTIGGIGVTTLGNALGNGSGTLTKDGAGTLILSGTNTYTGATIINAGTILINSDVRLGATPGTATTGHLTLNGGTLSASATFTLNSNRGIALGSSHGTITVADTKTLTYDGIIAGDYNLTKDGNGTLDLGGANTYTGTTTISDGTLQVTGTLGQTAVTVDSGATYDSDTTDTIGSITGAGAI